MIEIENYKRAVFQLADKLFTLKKEKGRDAALRVTNLDVAKINQLTAIGSFINRTHNLYPEHYLEVVGLDDKQCKHYLDLAVNKNLSPCQLRMVIRKDLRTVKAKKKKEAKIKTWLTSIENIQHAMSKMDDNKKERLRKILREL